MLVYFLLLLLFIFYILFFYIFLQELTLVPYPRHTKTTTLLVLNPKSSLLNPNPSFCTLSHVRMLTPYDLRLVPHFSDLRFSRSVLDLFSRIRSSRFSLYVRPSSFYAITSF